MKKKGHAASISFIGLVTVGFLAAGLGTKSWTVAELSRIQSNNETCIVARTLGLFALTDTSLDGCILPINEEYDVYCDKVVEFNYGLQYAVIVFCALSMLCCLIIMAVAAFNVCENPYQTYCSPFGLMIYNVIGLSCSLLAVVLYVSLLYTDLRKPLLTDKPDTVTTCAGTSNVYESQDYEVESDGYFGFSFFLMMSSIFIYCIGIAVSFNAQRTPNKRAGPRSNNENDSVHNDAFIF